MNDSVFGSLDVPVTVVAICRRFFSVLINLTLVWGQVRAHGRQQSGWIQLLKLNLIHPLMKVFIGVSCPKSNTPS